MMIPVDYPTLADATILDTVYINGRGVWVLTRGESDLPRNVTDDTIDKLLACATQSEWQHARVKFTKEADEERRAREELMKLYAPLDTMSREEFAKTKGYTTQEENEYFDKIKATADAAHYTLAKRLYDDLIERRAAAMETATAEQLSLAAMLYTGMTTQFAQSMIDGVIYSACKGYAKKKPTEQAAIEQVENFVITCRNSFCGTPAKLEGYITKPPADGEKLITFRQGVANGGISPFLSFLRAKEPAEYERVCDFLSWACDKATAILHQNKTPKATARKIFAHFNEVEKSKPPADDDGDGGERELVEVDGAGKVTRVTETETATVKRMKEPPAKEEKPKRLKKSDILAEKFNVDSIIISTKLKTHITPIAKAAMCVFNVPASFPVDIPQKVQVGNNKRRAEVLLTLNYDTEILDELNKNGEYKFSLTKPLNSFDNLVYGAVGSFWQDSKDKKYKDITIPMIYEVMTGTRNKHISQETTDRIMHSLAKLRAVHLVIDASDEFKRHNKKGNPKFDGNLLMAYQFRDILINGKLTNAIRIFSRPILHEYADRNGQIMRIPLEMLDVKLDSRGNTPVLVMELARRVLSKGTSTTILYEPLYDIMRTTNEAEKEKDESKKSKKTPEQLKANFQADVRAKVKTIFACWEERGFVSCFEEETEGKRKRAIKFTRPTMQIAAQN